MERAVSDPEPAHGIVSPVNSSWQKGPLSPDDKEKVTKVLAACRNRDLQTLAHLATSQGGLIEDEVRRTAWPILLGCHEHHSSEQADWTKLERHRDEEQVELDVNRSFVYYPENESKQRLDRRKSELSDLITSVLRQHPILCYFQGYHDIVQVLLLVLGADGAEAAVARLSLLRIRDFMLPTLSGAESHLHLLPAILYAADKELYQHLSGATQPTPFFALAATLTLYAHDIEEYGDIARLFDYLLASEAAVPVYLFAVIVMSRKKELLEIDHDEPEMLHSILAKLPKPLDIEGLITRTHTLFTQHPPQHLPYRAWSRVSNYSVLKTTRDPDAFAQQTLSYGEDLFQKQAAQIRRQDAVKRMRERIQVLGYRYRRPARWTGAAVLVAVLALYFGRANGAGGLGEWISTALSARHRVGELAQQVLSRFW
ncbi:hypothetical protein M409DRAFT_69995 [Zasmidium cellare ATCC 36951]|uniref:Rab-GAP TBC domain-containing protein n=1 Tax=Zasmidium cellare ATCC 36951 TaxID=1080233 RepID=A0A6A6C4E5_ZASCE|nr:uncharacterized protein M409DRAFT_69995 [Zasmidium cellare ATCC 36951]KAF2161158.1 hypothetical protein M409DRAFT_69995 [Zasmidium cellare ATCC 36951]